mmetsp:Transcript_12293/g.24286  ORF Transcript_12293/g.24286 Transcript_12293/m.24286 type:complete len:211 (-) Transcript_12293:270-902(-)
MFKNAWSGAAAPRARMPAPPTDAFTADRMYAWCGVKGTSATSSSLSSTTAAVAATGGGVGGGGGHFLAPLSTTSMPRTASSFSASMWYMPFCLVVCGPMESRNLDTLLAKRVDDVAASRLFMSVYPMHLTPLGVTTSSSLTVVPMLPPVSAARSTVTDPAFIISTASEGMSKGAGRPGIKAVEMMMSDSAAAVMSIARSAALYSSLISLA